MFSQKLTILDSGADRRFLLMFKLFKFIKTLNFFLIELADSTDMLNIRIEESGLRIFFTQSE